MRSNPSTTSSPSTRVAQVLPPSVDSCTPPLDIAKYRCAGSRGSTMIECSLGPSGVPSCTLPIHSRYCGSSLMPENGAQLTPPSSERNRPCGDVPAYQVSRSPAWPGVSQNVWSTDAPGGSLGRLRERRRPRGLLPVATEIGRAEHGRAEVAGLRRRQQGAPVARVELQVTDDVAEEVRPVDLPGLAPGVAVEEPRPLARRDQQDESA